MSSSPASLLGQGWHWLGIWRPESPPDAKPHPVGQSAHLQVLRVEPVGGPSKNEIRPVGSKLKSNQRSHGWVNNTFCDSPEDPTASGCRERNFFDFHI